MADERIVKVGWDDVGATLDAGKTPWVDFNCGLCKQRVAEEFHSVTFTTYHRVAEEEVVALRAALDAAHARTARLSGLLAALVAVEPQGYSDCDTPYCVYCDGEWGQWSDGRWGVAHDPACPWLAARAALREG